MPNLPGESGSVPIFLFNVLALLQTMIARSRSVVVAVLVVLGVALAAAPGPAQAAEGDGELTLEGIVNNTILGHATDGNYLNLEPFGSPELPRIMVVRTADGALSLEAYGSTKRLLTSGPYGLTAHGEGSGEGPGELITGEAELEEAIAAKEHLHSDVARTSGHVVVDLSITRHFVLSLLALLIVTGVFLTLARRYRRGTGRMEAPRGVFQNMMEVMVVFIRDEIAKPNIQGEKWRKFLPYLLTAFFFILVANILGLVPFAGAPTSNIAVTGVMAFLTFAIGLLYGSKDHYLELFTGPPDAPFFVRVIMVPIEIVGLVMRHLALAIRLFANMLGGSLIIFSLLGLIFIMNVVFGQAIAWGSTVISIGFTVFILLVKLLVAFIQAYVFTILSALFIGMSVEEHHHDEDHESDEAGHAGDLESRLDAVEEAVEPTPA
jgi:F-type H+-transporting ATPase subunit a